LFTLSLLSVERERESEEREARSEKIKEARSKKSESTDNITAKQKSP
jgi:hypothetical protein